MKYLPLLMAVLAVACGDDPLAPSPDPVVPPPPSQALCEVVVPGHPPKWLLVPGKTPIYIPGSPDYTMLVACDSVAPPA